MLKALLLDHDGTLVDSETLHGQHWAEVLASHGVELSSAEYHAHYAGYSTSQNAIDLIQQHGLTISQHALAQQKVAITQAWLKQQAWPLIEGASAIMQWASTQGLRQAIVTGGQRVSVERTLSYYQLAPFIEVVTSQEDAEHNKPAPDLYLLTLERLGLKAHEVLALEDTARGMQAALGAGIECVVVRNSYSQNQDFSGAAACVDSLPQALAWLKQRYGN
ncbi:HAD family hydrolase [Thiofilum flexile]|uniref:HAD family hydrolase n=1 Tax=Thiofilum flexile TaxID=125627 RepID=UPI00038272A9|nr:HAD family phosphatase [Thiofilum flexile]